MALATRNPQLAPSEQSLAIPPHLKVVSERLGFSSYVDWYLGDSNERWTDVAKDAYDAAVKILESELAFNERHTIWLRNQTSMKDVHEALSAAIREYDARPKDSKIRTWLASCSSRVMYYGAIFDTFSQHHPEYVSLVWGAMKFLFIGVLNHEEHLIELSKAVSRIADVLPRTELHSSLYPTVRMQEAVSQVYAKIVEFSVLAIKWYKKGRFSHSISALTKPFSLKYKPLLDDITDRSRRVDQLANAASKAEIRDLHIQVVGLDKRFIQMTEIMAAQQQQLALQSHSLYALQSDHRHTFQRARIEEMQSTVLTEEVGISDETLAYYRSMRNRRRQKTPTQLPRSALEALKTWISDPASSMLIAQGQGVRTSSADFAADFLDTILGQGYPIIWALPSNTLEEGTARQTFVCILKSLISQCLNIEPAIVSEGGNPITMKHFKSVRSIHQWYDLFARCTRSFARLFIIIDTNIIECAAAHQDGEDEYFKGDEFIERLSEIVSCRPQGGLKVVIASWKFDTSLSLNSSDMTGEMRIFTDMGRRIERRMRQPKFRLMYRRRNQLFSERLRMAVRIIDESP
ncbi:hypothetical protein GGS24DRAFT_513777 [Hypoxylon argillaceum]|nr:hypothetical protein GGS24DRAFT_513777 [Hypoxylon argillaceum]